ncbi:hypothetical protein BGHDH14_bgh03063 [Blumeria hordei DH14]|uniref:Uncharacterized protein n=1 Tax=Blumeria graminis f. sp. hordei (strain DH14) TaxID=546991 RepID=N1JRC5_BLUG1|nr:hypothetical protein BGHDH14_bgh03063 [Blumeria hordei DH14]
MFTAAIKASSDKIKCNRDSGEEKLELSQKCITINLPFKNVRSNFCHSQGKLNRILVLNSCLSHEERLHKEPSDIKTSQKLMQIIAKLIPPDGNLISPPSSYTSASHKISADKQIYLHQTRLIALHGLKSLTQLRIFLPAQTLLDDQIVLSVLAFTSSIDPWTTPAILQSAKHFISLQKLQIGNQDFIKNSILISFIRPLFLTSTPPKITASGRAVTLPTAPPKPHDFGVWDRVSKPWRLDACYSCTVLLWAVENASTTLDYFNLMIPPILTLLDFPHTAIRLRGLQILLPFLEKSTPKLLQQTGLGSVIEDAVQPMLLYLPPITPLEESLSLLPVAFTASFQILNSRFPATSLDSAGCEISGSQKCRHDSLNNLLQSVISAYQHTTLSSSSDPTIKEIILGQIPKLVRGLGIYCVAHLQKLIPLISDVLLDSFGAIEPKLLLTAALTLREIILCAWPRVKELRWRREIIRILVGCWSINFIEGSADQIKNEKLKEVREELRVVGRVFMEAITASGNSEAIQELELLLELDKNLIIIFGVMEAGGETETK